MTTYITIDIKDVSDSTFREYIKTKSTYFLSELLDHPDSLTLYQRVLIQEVLRNDQPQR